MSTSTKKTAVEFGEKASIHYEEKRQCSTSVQGDTVSLVSSLSGCSGAYRTVDFSGQKKMETYRKVNKMLGGK